MNRREFLSGIVAMATSVSLLKLRRTKATPKNAPTALQHKATAFPPECGDWISVNPARIQRAKRSETLSGFIGGAHVWNTVLTDEDAALLGRGCSPIFVKPKNLWMFSGIASFDYIQLAKRKRERRSSRRSPQADAQTEMREYAQTPT